MTDTAHHEPVANHCDPNASTIASGQGPSRVERRMAWCIIGVLAIIAAVMVHVQRSYDPAAWRAVARQQMPPADATAPSTDDAVPGLKALSAAERYTDDNLSDKINGKADLYLTAGFRLLETRRFALSNDSSRWMERFVYTMEGHRSAFAVFSQQRRSTGVAIDFADFGYTAANGLFFVHGPYYIEIISGEQSAEMVQAMQALATAFVDRNPLDTTPLTELALFPPADQVPQSIGLIAHSAFGLDFLKWVYTADYQSGAHSALAFVVILDTPEQAKMLADKVIAYWMEFGAEPVQVETAGAQAVTILDAFEIVAVQDRVLFGVHEADQLEYGRDVVQRMQRTIGASGYDTP